MAGGECLLGLKRDLFLRNLAFWCVAVGGGLRCALDAFEACAFVGVGEAFFLRLVLRFVLCGFTGCRDGCAAALGVGAVAALDEAA